MNSNKAGEIFDLSFRSGVDNQRKNQLEVPHENRDAVV